MTPQELEEISNSSLSPELQRKMFQVLDKSLEDGDICARLDEEIIKQEQNLLHVSKLPPVPLLDGKRREISQTIILLQQIRDGDKPKEGS